MFARTLLGLGIKIWLVTQPKISPSKVQVKSKLSMQTAWSSLKWLVAASDQKDVNFKIVQSLLSTKSQSTLAHNL